MAENYKLLYQQMKKIVTTYQDNVVPCLREIIKHLEQNQIKVRCKDCKHCMMCYPEKQIGKEATQGWYCKEFKGWRRSDDFCSCGERRTEDDHHRTE